MSIPETVYVAVEKTEEEGEDRYIDSIRCECSKFFHVLLYKNFTFPDSEMWDEFNKHVRRTGHDSFQMFVRKY